MRSRALAGGAVATLVAGMMLAVVVVAAPVARASVSTDAGNAVSYANQHGYHSAIGVYDTQNGTFAGAGDYNSTYASESVMKVFIATRLLMTGQMSGWNASTAYKMITQSDDASANALYGRTGGDSVITWIKQELNLPGLGSPPLRPGWWGGTQITASGMAQFYNVVRHRSDVWPWLGNAMHNATQNGSDGTYQFFGIPSATSGAAIKQGWGGDNAAGQPAFNSTGLVNSDRFAVVILTQGGVYGTPIASMLTSEARLLMPGGRIASDDPVGGVGSWSVHGRYVTVTGWAVDPNSLATPLRIFFYLNGQPLTYVQTDVPRGDINAAYHTSGNHGFSRELTLPDGRNTVCAYAINVGAGTNTTLGCRYIPLSGVPIGGISSAPQRGQNVVLNGWALDYDTPSTSLLVRAYVNGTYAGGAYTTTSRADINVAMHATGTHGFAFAIRIPTGASTICLYALNQGRGANANLGCVARTLYQTPIGALDIAGVQGNQVSLTGWVVDFDAPNTAIKYVLYQDGTAINYRATDQNRDDVNTRYLISGNHGFARTVTLTPGSHVFCLVGVNVGPGQNSSVGCKTVTISASAAANAPVKPAGPPSSSAPGSSAPGSSAPGSSAPGLSVTSSAVPSSASASGSTASTAAPSPTGSN